MYVILFVKCQAGRRRMQMVKIQIIINGSGGVGKDTLVDMIIVDLISVGITATKLSSVENIKSAMTMMGWDGIKDEKTRKLMSDLKDISTELWDGPMKAMKLFIKNTQSDVVFLMIREPHEIERFVREIPGTVTILVTSSRDGVEQYDNHADRDVSFYPYDEIVSNDSDEKSLEKSAKGIAGDIAIMLKG